MPVHLHFGIARLTHFLFKPGYSCRRGYVAMKSGMRVWAMMWVDICGSICELSVTQEGERGAHTVGIPRLQKFVESAEH